MAKVYYIKQSYAGYFKKLEVKELNFTQKENWTNNIYFENKNDAERFLKVLKECIKDNYDRAHDERWFDEEITK